MKIPICLTSTKTFKKIHFCDQNDEIKMKTGGSEIKDHYLTKKIKMSITLVFKERVESFDP